MLATHFLALPVQFLNCCGVKSQDRDHEVVGSTEPLFDIDILGSKKFLQPAEPSSHWRVCNCLGAPKSSAQESPARAFSPAPGGQSARR
jgi:hypothetical protein